MIYLVNCKLDNQFAIIGVDTVKGIFDSITTYNDDRFNRESLIRNIKFDKNKNFNFDFENSEITILEIENLFNIADSKLQKYDNQSTFFDCEGMLILPGCIDPHVHFDTPGYDFREDFESASAAAIAGGVTTIIDMPCTSIPPVTNRKNFNVKMAAIEGKSYCDYAFYGGICGKTIEEESFENNISDLVTCGVKGFKAYTISGMDSFPRLTNYQLYKAAKVCRDAGKPLLLHSEDFEFIDGYLKNNLNNLTSNTYKKIIDSNSPGQKFLSEVNLYCESRSDIAELIAVQTAVAIAEKTGVKLHIVHLSSAKAAKFIEKAKNYCNITFETAPHYLQWTEKDFQKYGSLIKTAPPVKREEDRIYLRKTIENNSCEFIASDHAACKIEEKNTGSFLKDYGGINGVQTIFQYIISEYLSEIPISNLIKLTSENAAKFYGIYPKKGAIRKGSDADFVLIRKDEKFTFKNDILYSKMKISPFHNFEFNHKIYATFLRGKPAYLSGKGLNIKKGEGKYL